MNPDLSNTIFQKAVSFVNQTGKHLFITGKAGTGKTTFLKYIKEHSYKKMAVVAPTGVAAINAGGMTIHSFFQLPLGIFLPSENSGWGGYSGEMNNKSTLLRNLKLRGEKRQVIQELDLLIIDEISMVRADLLDAIDTVLRHVRRQPLTPFGGVQMVYIGDLFQLPPVAKQEEWNVLQDYYKSPFFFDAHALYHLPPLYLELKKIYRQKDDAFINVLNNVRNNCCTNEDLQLLHEHYNPNFSPAKDENYIILTSHNNKADAINQRELNNLGGTTYTFKARISGEFYDRSFPADGELQLKVGAQVMFIKNDKGEARRFYNGKIGTIKNLEPEKITVVFPSETEELELEQETWENIKYTYNTEKDNLDEEELGTFTQYPIRLAWAITIHKSQGLTFEKAVIDAGASFAPGQVYVSLSRLTNLQGLVLHSRINHNCISTDKRVIEYVENEVKEDELELLLEQEKKAFVRQSLLQSFSWQKITDVVDAHLKDYEHRIIPDKEESFIWANNLNNHVTEIGEVAAKFTRQLEYLFISCEEDNYKKLHERTTAAAKYFLNEIEGKLLKPTKHHIESEKIKQKVKKYIKDLHQLYVLFARKKQQVEQALHLADALHSSINIDDLVAMVERNTKTPAAELEEELEVATKGKAVKGESGRISLQMFKQGQSIADISAARGMAASTIEGHLAGFVATGEIDILDLVDNPTLESVIKLIEKNPEITYSEIKEKSGTEVSYGAIKAILAYQQSLQKDNPAV